MSTLQCTCINQGQEFSFVHFMIVLKYPFRVSPHWLRADDQAWCGTCIGQRPRKCNCVTTQTDTKGTFSTPTSLSLSFSLWLGEVRRYFYAHQTTKANTKQLLSVDMLNAWQGKESAVNNNNNLVPPDLKQDTKVHGGKCLLEWQWNHPCLLQLTPPFPPPFCAFTPLLCTAKINPIKSSQSSLN